MATANDYAAWIVKNQSKQGTPEFDTVARAYELAKQEESASRVPEQPAAPSSPSLLDKAKGAGETLLSLATAPIGQVAGGLSAADALIRGIGYKLAGITAQAPDATKAYEQASQALTYAPKTQTGQEYLQGAVKTLEPLQALPGIQGEVGALSQAMRGLKTPAQVTMQAVKPAVAEAVQTVKSAIPSAVESPFGKGSVGAAETPQALQRRLTAESLPVPFEGESALTKGQATRDYGQLQFEKETAKLPDVGAPLRERAAVQNARLAQNLDALIDRANPATVEDLAVGKSVSDALKNRFNVEKKKVSALYQKAKESGETAEPVSVSPVVDVLNKSVSAEGNAPILGAVKREVQRLGGAIPDEGGNLVARDMSVNDLEELRKFVNANIGYEGPNLAYGKQIKSAIDTATEQAGGDIYKQARAARARLANEFENTALTNSLIENKRGTSERQVALDDVYKKVIQQSSLEELNKTRSSLLKAGPEGKQAWQDLKAKTIQDIKDRAFGNTSFDQSGNPVGSPAKLSAAIKALDREGKLEGLFGKKQAQQLRDLSEIANVIYTAPPGAVNTSNTTSALRIALDATATAGLTGLPVPAMTAIKEAAKYVKNREVRTRVNQALGASK